MALVPYIKRHRNGLARFHRDMDELFGSFFSGPHFATYFALASAGVNSSP